MLVLLTVLVLISGITGSVSADTLHVPAEYPSIQAAVEAAAEGDEIILASRVYRGVGFLDINFEGRI